MFTAALFLITKKWKQFKCPSADEQIKYLYLNNGIFGNKKK